MQRPPNLAVKEGIWEVVHGEFFPLLYSLLIFGKPKLINQSLFSLSASPQLLAHHAAMSYLRTLSNVDEALRTHCYFLFSRKIFKFRLSNIFAKLRKMENDLQALLTVEKHDATLGEVGESVRKEILDRRQRNGKGAMQ